MVVQEVPFLVAQAETFLVDLGDITLDEVPVEIFQEVPAEISLGGTFLVDLTQAVAKVELFLVEVVEMVDLGETSTPSITPLRTTDGADRQARLCTTLLTV